MACRLGFSRKPQAIFRADPSIAVRPIGRKVTISLFVFASDFSEKWIPLFGPMLSSVRL
jgi:hypothetical protein